ncbi:MAG: SDR family oxidoreductase [Porticoccaceae bacterium]
MWNNVQYSYSGANVLVTGGTGGLGYAIADAFARAGAAVTITGTKPSPTDYDKDLGRFDYLQLDVENNAHVDAVGACFERLDVLVHSAGVAFYVLGLDEFEPDNFERAIKMHLTSVYRLSENCSQALKRSILPGGASVIHIASMTSFFGMEPVPAYGSAKTGLLGLTRVLAVRWARDNIRVNAIACGMVESGMTKPMMDQPEVSNQLLARVPMGRHGQPGDISGAALFLSSDAASWITGQALPVDGGFSIAG